MSATPDEPTRLSLRWIQIDRKFTKLYLNHLFTGGYVLLERNSIYFGYIEENNVCMCSNLEDAKNDVENKIRHMLTAQLPEGGGLHK